MKKVLTFALLTTILGLSTGLQGASSYRRKVADPPTATSQDDKRGHGAVEKILKLKIGKSKTPKERERSVPAPSPLLLIGVAAGVVWGLRKLRPHRRVE